MVAAVLKRLDDTLRRAAELRTGGSSWPNAAGELGLETDSLRQLVLDDEPRWKKLLREAEKNVLRETGYESLLILRKLMRHPDVKIQRDCSIAFLKAWMAMLRHRPAAKRADGTPFESAWDEGITDDQFRALALHSLAGLGDDDTPAGDDRADDPPGPDGPGGVPPLPPPRPGGAGGPAAGGPHGFAEPSERASAGAGGAAEGSRQDDAGLSARLVGAGPRAELADQDCVRQRSDRGGSLAVSSGGASCRIAGDAKNPGAFPLFSIPPATG